MRYYLGMERADPFLKDEYFHVYNRGVDKRKIFFVENDYKHFLLLLRLINTDEYFRIGDLIRSCRINNQPLDNLYKEVDPASSLVDIVAFCLMPNHFHLVIRGREDGSISKFMAKFSTAFAMYMNIKYDRTGPLMCRPFRAKHIGSDEYFKWLMSYIHLNPTELIGESNVTKAKFLKEYSYSSYYDYYIGARPETSILQKDAMPISINSLEDPKAMLEEVAKNVV